ncbi:hypothetical protein M404DRAFT_995181 [Pisolithus tinctorius Marx 270]|uniref:Uncharacterized protein n=1 Tax=Pisolithus tinctorius Marx 270 TaxID=870435 RepID=A0A0C3PP73_PISTI|nr:hypothetical protein M404DRAFT_995181 [Pisolithus tinctorius Marx 270]
MHFSHLIAPTDNTPPDQSFRLLVFARDHILSGPRHVCEAVPSLTYITILRPLPGAWITHFHHAAKTSCAMTDDQIFVPGYSQVISVMRRKQMNLACKATRVSA